jgi:hypothetical protein
MRTLFGVFLIVVVAFGLAIIQAQITPPAAANLDAPHEPGMYLQTTNGFTKVLGQIVSFTRTGSLFVSKVTVGIKARKQNVQLLGPHAQTTAGEKPVFFFIPPKQEAEAGVNAGDFILIRLEEKPQRRQFEVGAEGAWRASKGISITHQIQLERSEVKPGSYSIIPSVGLTKGEYALYLARGEGMQAYVYDFSVDPESTLTTGYKSENGGPSRPADPPTSSSTALSKREAIVEITSDPVGADIEIDSKFVGSTPSSVGLLTGEHKLKVSKDRYRGWERNLQISTGKIKITAELEPLVTDPTPLSSIQAATATVSKQPPANSSESDSEEVWIGISFTGNPALRQNGLVVSGVRSKGPAEEIGIQTGDVILAADGHYVYTIEEFRVLLRAHDRGVPVGIRYRHDRLTYENKLSFASRNAPSSQ